MLSETVERPGGRAREPHWHQGTRNIAVSEGNSQFEGLRGSPGSMSSGDLSFLAELLDTSTCSLFVKDPTGGILLSNSAFCRDFLANPEGGTPYLRLPPELQEISAYTDRHLVHNRTVLQFSYPMSTSTGERRRYATTKIPILSRSGQVSAIFGISRQIPDHCEEDPWAAKDFFTMRNAVDVLADLGDESRRIIQLSCRGVTTKAIARQLDVSTRSVERVRAAFTRAIGEKATANMVRAVACLQDCGMGQGVFNEET